MPPPNNRPVDPHVPGSIGGFDHRNDPDQYAHYELWGCVRGEASGTFQRESDDPDDYPDLTDEDMRHAAAAADGVRSETPPLDPVAYETPLDDYFDEVNYDEASKIQLGGKDPWTNQVFYRAWKSAWMARKARRIAAKRHDDWLAQGAAVFHPDGIDRTGSAIVDATDLDNLLIEGARKSGADAIYMNKKVFDFVRRHPSVIGKLPDNVNQIHDEKSFAELYLGPQTGVGRVVITRAHHNPKKRDDYIFGDHIVFARTEMAGVGRDPTAPAEGFMIPVNPAGAVRVMRSVNYWDQTEMKLSHGSVLSDPAVVPNPQARRRLAGFTYVAGEYQVRGNKADIGLLRAESHVLLDRTAIYTILEVFGG